MKEFFLEYKEKKSAIKKRLKSLSRVHKGKDEDIFSELCFCLFTPQSKAVNCEEALMKLKKSGLLFNGNQRSISAVLKGRVRFHNNKAAYLVCARELLKKDNRISIKEKIDIKDIMKTREWLVRNIKGLGYKEASHFLRNIGLGKDLAIIDRHILKNLIKHRAIRSIPKSIGKKTYFEIEKIIRDFSKKINIPMDELDFLFWSNQTGFIFK